MARRRKQRRTAKQKAATRKMIAANRRGTRRLTASKKARRLKAKSIRAEGGYSYPDEMLDRKHYPYQFDLSKKGRSIHKGHSSLREYQE
jgi:hypothetical protein